VRAALARLLPALLLAATLALAEVPVPALEARVTDLTGTLTAQQRGALEESLRAFEALKGAQLAVLLVPTTAPETIEQYAIRVAEAWKLGRQGVDDGLLLLVAKDDRRMRIEVGYGLEGAVPDAIAKRVIAETITQLPSRRRSRGLPRIYFAAQVQAAPPTFVFFVNDPGSFPPAYRRYVENKLRERFPFPEIPLRLVFRRRTSRDAP